MYGGGEEGRRARSTLQSGARSCSAAAAVLGSPPGAVCERPCSRSSTLVHALVHACASCSCLETSTEQEQTCQQTSFYIFNLQPKACSVNTDLFTQRGQWSQDRAAASAGVHTAPGGLPEFIRGRSHGPRRAAEHICRALPQLLNKIARPALATFFDTDFLQCQCQCVCVSGSYNVFSPRPKGVPIRRGPATHPPLVAARTCRCAPDDRDPRIQLFTQGPTVNYLLRGDPQVCYGDPGTPSDRTRRHPACACCSLYPHTPLPRPHPTRPHTTPPPDRSALKS